MLDGPRKGRRVLLVLAASVALILLLLFWGEYDLVTLWRLDRERRELSGQVEQLKVENQGLIDQIDGLQDNPEMIEKIARENLGMARKGETVYRILPAERDTLLDSLKIRE
ncbi:septum formation initiator family protein [bacterium]|nr:septum formation initiator family protein [bacterium]